MSSLYAIMNLGKSIVIPSLQTQLLKHFNATITLYSPSEAWVDIFFLKI